MQEVFDDSYVEQLQNFIHKIKGSREMEVRFMIFEEMLKDERAEGREEGLALGLENAKSTLLLCLQSFGTVSETICDQIQSQQELEVLKQWTKIAFQSKSLEEFEKEDFIIKSISGYSGSDYLQFLAILVEAVG